MTQLECIYNNFHNHLVSFEQNHSELVKYITNIPEDSSSDRLFVRKRALGITEMLSFMIMPRAETLCAELSDFAAMSHGMVVSKSAFSQRRRNISETILSDLNGLLVKDYFDSPLPRKWKGRYLIAVDGTTISLPRGKIYGEMFGVAKHAKSGQERPTARAIFLVDALNHTILIADLARFSEDEATTAWNAISRLPQEIIKQSVFLFDRLYPSLWLLTLLYNNNIQFVMRCRTNFSPAIDGFFKSRHDYQDVKIDVSDAAWYTKTSRRYEKMGISESESRPIYLHLSKSVLPSGETEVIASHVLNLRISAAQAYRIYGCRWGVETVIGQEKNEEQIEIFSGRTKQCVLQDFYSKVISHNLCQISANYADRRLKSHRMHANKQKDGSKLPPTELQVNLNIAIYQFRNACIKLLYTPNIRILRKFIDTISLSVIPVIPGRHNPRDFIHYKVSGKYVTFTNYGRAI